MSESDARPFPVLDPASVEPRRGAAYPEHLRGPFAAREKRALGDPLGLTSFGVNLTRLPPGTASALRHWHSLEDEFVMVLEGEATLITEAGETVLGPGMAAGFPKGKADGHHLVNRGKSDVVYLEVGDRRPATTSPTRTMTWPRFGAMAGASTSTRTGGRTENDRWLSHYFRLRAGRPRDLGELRSPAATWQRPIDLANLVRGHDRQPRRVAS
jgi:uncharacterized cupin superfamily protein